MDETDSSWRHGSGPVSLSASEVHLWKVSLEQPPERIRAFQKMLSPEESQRNRDSFRICRGYLRLLLGRYAGLAPEQVRLTRGPYGKLALDPGIHQQNIEFNVSHSGRLALIALAKARRLGVDIEKVGPGARIDLITRRFFSPQEDESIRALPDELKTAAFHACWARKEAVVKALGGSITELSGRIIVSAAPSGPARILTMPPDEVHSEWHLHDLPVDEGYAAALCYGGPPAALFLWQPEE